YFILTGEKATDDSIDNLLSSRNIEVFLQKAIQDQGRGQIMDTVSEIQERHDAIIDIEKNLAELHQVFLDTVVLLDSQGPNDIESQGAHATTFVGLGTEQVVHTRELQRRSQKCTCIAVTVVVVIVIIIMIIFLLLPKMLPLD
ncbi:syntaxin-124-like protein, partial [Tanacetum coccineum]